MHLRLCRTCGHVGCCDDSPNKHATKHFHATQHPIIEGYDPPEGWGWCYVDEVFVDLGDDTTPQRGPISEICLVRLPAKVAHPLAFPGGRSRRSPAPAAACASACGQIRRMPSAQVEQEIRDAGRHGRAAHSFPASEGRTVLDLHRAVPVRCCRHRAAMRAEADQHRRASPKSLPAQIDRDCTRRATTSRSPRHCRYANCAPTRSPCCPVP